jgi:hypothetical protein
MGWPPQLGEPLPRAAHCWYERIKVDGWILDPGGHGPEWERVFQVTVVDREKVWSALAVAIADLPILEVRDRGGNGIVCGVRGEITIGKRSAPVTMSWHYAAPDSAPRLVTAYPSP